MPAVKLNWLDRQTVTAPFLALCLTEKEFLAAAKHCGIKAPGEWMDLNRHKAVVHTWELKGVLTCVVCLHPDATQTTDSIDVAQTLVHESVHIFQSLCESIGEYSPSMEFEAYSIEKIAGRLMREFARRIREDK